MDEAWAATLMLLIFGWCCFFIQADRDYFVKQQAVSNITYRYTQIASKKGELSEAMLQEMETKLQNYGEFEIWMSAEKFEPDNTIDVLEAPELVDYDLRGNDYDLINIRVESKNEHYLAAIFRLSPMGATKTNYKLMSQSSAYIQ